MQTIIAPNTQITTPLTSQALRVIAIGDSLVYGFGDPVGGGWVERLRRQWMYLDNSGHALYNLGIRGDGVAKVASRLEQEFRYRGELRNRVPDVMMIAVGVNDTPRLGSPDGKNFTDFGQFQQQINNLLDSASQLCPVKFIGLVPVDEQRMPFLSCFYYNHQDQHRYKEATKEACKARQIPYLDIFDLWLSRGENWWKSRLCPDGLHPNVEGYQSLLEDILAWDGMADLLD